MTIVVGKPSTISVPMQTLTVLALPKETSEASILATQLCSRDDGPILGPTPCYIPYQMGGQLSRTSEWRGIAIQEHAACRVGFLVVSQVCT